MSIASGGVINLSVANQDGYAVPACAVTWSSSDSSVATVTTAGLARGAKAGGPVQITAVLGAARGSMDLIVR